MAGSGDYKDVRMPRRRPGAAIAISAYQDSLSQRSGWAQKRALNQSGTVL